MCHDKNHLTYSKVSIYWKVYFSCTQIYCIEEPDTKNQFNNLFFLNSPNSFRSFFTMAMSALFHLRNKKESVKEDYESNKLMNSSIHGMVINKLNQLELGCIHFGHSFSATTMVFILFLAWKPYFWPEGHSAR